jgi:hypothetical protein
MEDWVVAFAIVQLAVGMGLVVWEAAKHDRKRGPRS